MTDNLPKRIGPWSDAENAIIAAHYVRMLALETDHKPFNKSAIRRQGLIEMQRAHPEHAPRSPGSWELKCCNISAMLNDAGLQYVNGYKPLGHGQGASLRNALRSSFIALGWHLSANALMIDAGGRPRT